MAKPITSTLARRWQITVNEGLEDREKVTKFSEKIRGVFTEDGKLALSEKHIRYYIACIETAPTTGHIHSHIYVELLKAMVGGSVTKLFQIPGAHLEKCKGSQQDNINYVKKDGCFWEQGEPAKANKYESLVDDIKRGDKLEDITEAHPEEVIKSRANVLATMDMYAKQASVDAVKKYLEKFKPNKFQQEILDMCEKEPDDRTIVWLADPAGKSGKTVLLKMLFAKFGLDKVLALTTGRLTDIAQAWTQHSIVVFAYSRSLEESVNYPALESVKDGIMFRTKWNSGCDLHPTPHVIVLANFGPDTSKLTKDRWDVRWISQNPLPFYITSDLTAVAAAR